MKIPRVIISLLLMVCSFLLSVQVNAQVEVDTFNTYKITMKNGTIHVGKIFQEYKEVILFKTDAVDVLNLQREQIRRIEPQFDFFTPDDNIFRVIMHDGNEFYGLITLDEEYYIDLQTSNLGVLRIPRRFIDLIEVVSKESLKDGKIWLENLQATRYFWAPNGYGLKKKEGYYQNIWVLFNQASIGVTDYFSIGGGTIPLFLFDGAPTPVFIVPKFSFPVIENKFNVGAGVIAGTILGEEVFDNSNAFGIAYGVATLGNLNNNLNIGVGMPFVNGEFSQYPMFSLGGMARLGKRSYLLTENYYIPGDDFWLGLFSVGGRTVWQKVSLDYGAVIPFGEDFGAFVVIPWLSLSVPFQY